MQNKSPFSGEYNIGIATESQASIQESSNLKDKNTDDPLEKIKADYQLSKPRRKIIHARIIS